MTPRIITNELIHGPQNKYACGGAFRATPGRQDNIGAGNIKSQHQRTATPKIKPGFHRACEAIKATKKFVVYSGKERFPMPGNTEAIGIVEMLRVVANG